MDPRDSVGAAEAAVGFFVVGDALLGAVPLQRAAQFHRQVRQNAARRRDVPLLDVGDRTAAGLAGFEQIQHMDADGRGDVLFEILLRLILGILLQLVLDVAVDRRPTRRLEVVAVDAALERPLVAVERRAPRVLRVGCRTPRAVCPDDGVQTELKRGGLRIADVGPARLVDVDAAVGRDVIGPAEVEHPANHVEHGNAHVADNAVPVEFQAQVNLIRCESYSRLVSLCSDGPDREGHPNGHVSACHPARGQVSAAILPRIAPAHCGNDCRICVL
jgi:hypothetical protein